MRTQICPTCGREFVPTNTVQKACSHGCQRTPAERFWNRVDKNGGLDACWPWTGPLTTHGYGHVLFHHVRDAHRVAWTLTNGPIPKGMHVCHHCDNPPCCNATHLFVGTHADNLADMRAKGRGSGGSRPGESALNARLSDAFVREARGLRLSGWTFTELGKLYGVSRITVMYAVTGRTWRHLDGAVTA